MPSTEWIAIGIVKRPVGLAGFCAVEPFGATWAALQLPCEVRIGKDIGSAERQVIEEIVVMPKGCRCRFGAKNDRAAVEGLRGFFVYIEQSGLPRLGKGSYYHFELKGAGVYADVSGDRMGTVIEVHNFPSADTLEVQRASGDSLLLPLSGQAIAAVDTAGGRITVRQSFVEELLQ
jgi:16S rRNA processing protein RimM